MSRSRATGIGRTTSLLENAKDGTTGLVLGRGTGRSNRALLGAILAIGWGAGPVHAMAQPGNPAHWHDLKCERYKRAWDAALAHQGPAGLGRSFLDAHAAFLASNCTQRSEVCARSPEELKLANTMVVLSMNFGAASTFAPFYCR